MQTPSLCMAHMMLLPSSAERYISRKSYLYRTLIHTLPVIQSSSQFSQAKGLLFYYWMNSFAPALCSFVVILTSGSSLLRLVFPVQYADREFASDAIWPPRLIRASDQEVAEASPADPETADAFSRKSDISQRVSLCSIA